MVLILWDRSFVMQKAKWLRQDMFSTELELLKLKFVRTRKVYTKQLLNSQGTEHVATQVGHCDPKF
jgi:hypothetical protein